MNVMPKANYGWDGKDGRRRVEYIVTVVFFDKDRAAKPQADRPGNTDCAQRLIRKVQK